MNISIIIPTYNRSDKLDVLLESIGNANNHCQTIVVDDQSTDDTPQVANKYDVEYTQSTGEGQIKAKQVGFQMAEGDVIGFLEDDMVVTDSFLDPVIQAFENGEQIVQSKVVFRNHGFEAKNEDVDRLVEYRWNFNHTTNWHLGQTGQYIPFGLESGRFVCQSVFDEVPLVDTNLIGPGFGESVSFCLRARKRRYQIYFEPNSVIYHVGAGDGGSSERFGKDLSSSDCSKYDYYRFHNNMYIHTRFFPLYILPALVYHTLYTTGIRTGISRDISCVKQIPKGLFKGLFTGFKYIIHN